MKLTKITLRAACGLLAIVGATATSYGQTRYDFAYNVTDDRVQVFDDGVITRISLPDGVLIPTVIAVQPKGEVLLTLQKDPPHLMLEGIHSRLVLRWGNGREVIANYRGQTDLQTRAGAPASYGAVKAVAVYGTAAQPIAAQRATKLAGASGEPMVIPVASTAPAAAVATTSPPPAAAASSSLTVTDISSSTPKSNQLEQTASVVSQPVAPASETTASETTKPATNTVTTVMTEPVSDWFIENSDGTLARALMRWTAKQGVPLLWEADKERPAIYAQYLQKTFAEALKQAMLETRRSKYPVHACAYDNAIVILHISQMCSK